ncbi:MAG: PspA/IM30 family protein [Gammaproteobacteria bacterium]
MPLIHRFTQLLTADLNAVLDRIEQPEVLLRQAVRDMESELEQLAARARLLGAERERAVARTGSEQALTARLDGELDLCLAADEHTLARDLVRRKLESGRRAAEARAAADEAERSRAELEALIEDGRRRLAGMQEKLEVMLDADADSAAPAAVSGPSEAEIDIALLAEQQRRQPS